jgi:hypothetical protein
MQYAEFKAIALAAFTNFPHGQQSPCIPLMANALILIPSKAGAVISTAFLCEFLFVH